MAVKRKFNAEQVFDLDNSAIIYAATNKKNWNRVFRVSAVLKDEIQPKLIAQAIADLRDRFPSYFVQLKEGFFDYSLRTVKNTDILVEENQYPCRPVAAGSGEKPMFRVTYYKNRLSLEVFHIITDGSGAITFLKNIIARYLELQGIPVENTSGVVDLNEEPREFETEDSFLKIHCEGNKKISRKEAAAYKYMPQIKEDYFKVIHGLIPIDDIKMIVKEKGVTVTEFLVAAYAWSILRNLRADENKKPIKISVPADLRRMFDSNTLRNFSLFVNICIPSDKANFTFDEILAETKQQLREGLSKETMGSIANKNVSAANSAFFRLTPLFIKKRILQIGFVLLGERLVSTCFSNCGIVKVPAGMESYINYFDVVLGGTPKNHINCALVTYNNILNISFSSRSETTEIQRLFFTFLSSQGINVKIQANV